MHELSEEDTRKHTSSDSPSITQNTHTNTVTNVTRTHEQVAEAVAGAGQSDRCAY